MRRVVITGLGIVSSLGNNKAEVLDSLQQRPLRHYISAGICR